MNEICLQLNEKQIPTPGVYGYQKGYITSEKNIGSGLWQMTVRQILMHEIYTGKLVQGRSDSWAKKQTAVDKDKWIVVPNTHEAIISQGMFDKAQERIEQQQTELKNLRAYISKNQNFLNSLYENLVNGIITQEEYQEMRTSYGDKISDTLRKINEVESRQAELEKQYSQYCDLSDAVSVITENNTLTKEFINKLISRIEIYKGKKVEITYSFDNEFEGEVSANV